jgi:hypothetical protein
MHLAFHVFVRTLIMAYHFFEMCLTLVMAYIPIKMYLTLAMAYIFIKMNMAPHVGPLKP